MARPLSTSIFKVALLVAVIAAPWLAMNTYLNARIDLYGDQLRLLDSTLSHDFSGADAVIGDCTVYPLNKALEARKTGNFRILGFGGSSVAEWFYLIKNHAATMDKARFVVVATPHAFRYQDLTLPYTSFLPYLMSWKDIFDYRFRSHAINNVSFLRYLLAKILRGYSESQVVRYKLLNQILPNYFQWHTAVIQNLTPPPDKDTPAPTRWNVLPELAALAKKEGIRLVLVLNPRTKRTVSETFLAEKKEWLEKCASLGLRCIDLSRTRDDKFFTNAAGNDGDGLHLTEGSSLSDYLKDLKGILDKER